MKLTACLAVCSTTSNCRGPGSYPNDDAVNEGAERIDLQHETINRRNNRVRQCAHGKGLSFIGV